VADWLSTIGGALQQAGGLGLAGAQGLAKGLGLVQERREPGLFGVPQHRPEDLSDLNPVQRLVSRLHDSVASLEGTPDAMLPSAQARQQRAQQNSQRMGAYKQGIEMLEQFDGIRDRARPSDYDRIDALLKRRFGELAGGKAGEADEFYDTFMSSRGLTPALLELAQADPGAQQLLAAGGTMGDLRKYLTAPERLVGAFQRADARHLAPGRNKLEAITNTKDPELRRELAARIQKAGGRPTLQMIRDMAEAGLVPDGMLPTTNEWEALQRNEEGLAEAGFQASPEVLKRREQGYTSDLKQKEDANRISLEHKARMEQIELEAFLDPKDRGITPGKELEFTKWIETKRQPFFRAEAEIQKAMRAPMNGYGDIQALFAFMHQQDDSAVKEGEYAVARAAQSALARLETAASGITEGRQLGDEARKQIRGIMVDFLDSVRGQHKGFLKRMIQASGKQGLDTDSVMPGAVDFVNQPDVAPVGPPQVKVLPGGEQVLVQELEDGSFVEVVQ
jgi:hypothetical protein